MHPAMKLYSANSLYFCESDNIETNTGSKKSSLYFFKIFKLSIVSAGEYAIATHIYKNSIRETITAGYRFKHSMI